MGYPIANICFYLLLVEFSVYFLFYFLLQEPWIGVGRFNLSITSSAHVYIVSSVLSALCYMLPGTEMVLLFESRISTGDSKDQLPRRGHGCCRSQE